MIESSGGVVDIDTWVRIRGILAWKVNMPRVARVATVLSLAHEGPLDATLTIVG